MKRLKLVSLLSVAALALSGCLIVATGPSVSVSQFQSSWQRVADQAYVFCTNDVNQLSYVISYDSRDSIVNWTETYTGEISGRPPVTITRYPSDFSMGARSVQVIVPVTFPATPQSVGGVNAQSISVTPVNPPQASNNGFTNVEVSVKIVGGGTASGSYRFATYANCPR